MYSDQFYSPFTLFFIIQRDTYIDRVLTCTIFWVLSEPIIWFTTVDEPVRQMWYPHDFATFPVVGVTSLRRLLITVVQ
jgi:hypothetical protein